MDPRNINIEEYDYELPGERIARHPLAVRDSCKLLCRDSVRLRPPTTRGISKGPSFHRLELPIRQFQPQVLVEAKLWA